ncbi:MAG: hypothetical protein KF758_05535 [Anaerolineales bacterium]|nr:hypothetical protein [Anaerolineales bacterium]
MAVKKSKIKSKPTLKSKKVTAKAKPVAKKKVLKAKPIRKPVMKAKSKVKAVAKKMKPVKKNRVAKMNKTIATKPVMKSLEKLPTQTMEEVSRQMMASSSSSAPSKRPVTAVVRRVVRPAEPVIRTATQFTFMKAPAVEHAFEVGDNVEVFCDHEKSRERIRGWIKGIVVQVDNKMVAVQFRSNVFLTDGWMVPDRILWYPLNSEHIRPVPGKKAAVKKELIPDY